MFVFKQDRIEGIMFICRVSGGNQNDESILPEEIDLAQSLLRQRCWSSTSVSPSVVVATNTL